MIKPFGLITIPILVIFVLQMMLSVPPLNDLFNMAGMELLNYLKGANAPDAGSKVVVEEPESTPKKKEKE